MIVEISNILCTVARGQTRNGNWVAISPHPYVTLSTLLSLTAGQFLYTVSVGIPMIEFVQKVNEIHVNVSSR